MRSKTNDEDIQSGEIVSTVSHHGSKKKRTFFTKRHNSKFFKSFSIFLSFKKMFVNSNKSSKKSLKYDRQPNILHS